nr:PREDICTED: uncharacterized protein LOC102693237 isoform X1 [Lepisosteus oculatus]XP_015212804.1 PREDICTED: uncharacterized protein LOC102693237 isoform X1 [Lepisosteus oculatus]
MASEFTTIQVFKVPSILPADRMTDKLMIHFLRPRNGGGEVLGVKFPMSTPGQALVTFELLEVADRVLQRDHVLELEGQRFPLELKKLEIDIPAETNLDLQMFPDQSSVWELLQRHRFRVTHGSPGQLHLQGTFLGLSVLRTQLQELLLTAPPARVRGPPHHHYPLKEQEYLGTLHINGYAAGSKTKVSQESTMLLKQNGAVDIGGTHHSRSPPFTGSTIPSRESLRSPAATAVLSGSFESSSFTYPSPSRSGDSSHEWLESFRSDASTPRHRADLSFSASSSQSHSPRSSAHPQTSFVIDTHVIRYAQRFKSVDVQEILKKHSLRMNVQGEGSELSTVTLLPAFYEAERGTQRTLQSTLKSACDELSSFLSLVGQSLRTQEVHLSSCDHDQRAAIAKSIPVLAEVYSVLVKQRGDTIYLVGSSRGSYEMKLRLLGEELSLPGVGREGRGVRPGRTVTRSSSLPRTPSRTGVRVPEQGSPRAQGYSPSKYQKEDVGPGKQMQEMAALMPCADREVPRRRSHSETRNKHLIERPVQGESSLRNMQSGIQKHVGLDPVTMQRTERQSRKTPTILKSLGDLSKQKQKVMKHK